jgi:cell division septum initiation protein DivIVA
MNIDSALRMINKHLKEVFDMFGGQSEEYMNALSQVRENIPQEVLNQTARSGNNYAYDLPTKPLQISRSKNAKEIYNNFANDLQQLRNEQKISGTAKMQSQKYIKELQEKGIKPTVRNVRQQANELYNFRNNNNDWYTELTNSPYLTDVEISDIKSDYSELNGADDVEYAQLRKSIREKKNKYEKKIQQEIKKAIEAAAQAETGEPPEVEEIDPLTLI